MIKVAIVVLLIAVVISLFSGLFFLVKGEKKSFRLVNSLAVRASLAALLVILVIYAVYTGQLTLNPSPISAF